MAGTASQVAAIVVAPGRLTTARLGRASVVGPTRGAALDLPVPDARAGDVLLGLPRLTGRVTVTLGPAIASSAWWQTVPQARVCSRRR